MLLSLHKKNYNKFLGKNFAFNRYNFEIIKLSIKHPIVDTGLLFVLKVSEIFSYHWLLTNYIIHFNAL